ncbi:class E sortase [Streptomyces sp. NPDC002133]|uniref:class E sortase n=1 Tax=Streptomyces sp. NPDC002133 TaxID=3154409 RepID=UPI003332B967
MSRSRTSPFALRRGGTATAALAGAVVAVLVGCSTGSGAGAADKAAAVGTAAPRAGVTTAIPAAPPPAAPTTTPTPPSTPTTPPAPSETGTRTEPASLSIPSIGIEGLRVVPYEGTTDDLPGTRIQNGGAAASPYGEHGGVGPGEVGNYLVTAHRLSAGGPLRELPSVGVGDKVLVAHRGTIYEYTVTENRRTSFRSERSPAEQRAAVPGSPGKQPTKGMITLSTCATPEDNAAGNYWRDDRGNPEHRIDRVGVLTAMRDSASTGTAP